MTRYLPQLKLESGSSLKNVSKGNLTLKCPKCGIIHLASGQFLDLTGYSQADLDVFYDLRKAVKLGLAGQFLQMEEVKPSRRSKKEKEVSDAG